MAEPVEQPKKRLPWRTWLLALCVVVLLIYKAYSTWYWRDATVRVGNATMHVLVADTLAHNVKGWSGRKSMGAYQGMLFYFPTREQHTMVMRDMEFPLDIIWIDRGVVIDIAPHLAPEKGRSEDELTPYYARGPSTMVLEIGSGKAEEYGIKVGDTITIAL